MDSLFWKISNSNPFLKLRIFSCESLLDAWRRSNNNNENSGSSHFPCHYHGNHDLGGKNSHLTFHRKKKPIMSQKNSLYHPLGKHQLLRDSCDSSELY